jgi:hypothetical protein
MTAILGPLETIYLELLEQPPVKSSKNFDLNKIKGIFCAPCFKPPIFEPFMPMPEPFMPMPEGPWNYESKRDLKIKQLAEEIKKLTARIIVLEEEKNVENKKMR